MEEKVEKRYDRDVLGKLDHEYDIVCPLCLSAVGFPCTRQGVYGNEQIKDIHKERLDKLNGKLPNN